MAKIYNRISPIFSHPSGKKKNGSRLCGKRQMKNSINKTVEKEKSLTCKLAFPKINLADPSKTPRVVIFHRIYDPSKSRLPTPSIG